MMTEVSGGGPASSSAGVDSGHALDTVDGGGFVISVREDKLVFVRKSEPGVHYTLHFGPERHEVDVHRTWTGSDGQVRRERLFVLTHEEVGRLLCEALEATWEYLRGLPGLLRPLRLGWLAHRRIAIVAGIYPMTGEEIARAGVVTKNGRRVRIDPERHRAAIHVPEYLNELIDGPRDNYMLVATRRRRGAMIGITCRAKRRDGRVDLYWFKLRDVRAYTASLQAKMGPILERWIELGTRHAQEEVARGHAP